VRHLFNFTDVRGIDIPHNRLTPPHTHIRNSE